MTPTALKEEISGYKRRRLMEEAAQLFFESGYAAVTLDAIADRLSVTKPFVYSYYKNKRDLLFEVCSTGISLSLEAMDEVFERDLEPTEALRLLSEKVLRIIIDYQEYIVVYVREEKNLEPAQAREIREKRSLFDHRLAQLLEDGAESGDFNLVDPVLTATAIAGMMTWVALWYSPSGKRSETEIISHTMNMIKTVV